MNKNIKIILGLIVAVLVVWGIYSIIQKPSEPVEGEVIKIGAVYPLTGMFAEYGENYRNGLELAIKEINARNKKNNKNTRYELIVEDDAGATVKSVSAATKLLNIDNVDILMASFSYSNALIPLADKKQKIMFSATVSPVGDGSKYVFRDLWDMQKQGSAIGSALIQENVKRLGIIAMNFDCAKEFLDGLKLSFPEDNIISIERFNLGDKDFRTQLMKLKSKGIDAISIYAFIPEAASIIKQMGELKMTDVELFGGAATLKEPFVTNAIQQYVTSVEKIIGVWYSVDDTKDNVKEFIKKYKIEYGKHPRPDAAYTYDDVYAIDEALQQCLKFSTDCLRKNLLKTNMEGIAGNLSFDSNGNSDRPAFLVEYTKGNWEEYKIR